VSALSAAFYTALSGNAAITNVLSTFDGRAAIFTYEPVPKDVEGNYIVTAGEISDLANDTKNSTGRIVQRDIKIWCPASGSSLAIESLAEAVRTLFHRSSLSVTGFKTIYVSCSGPRDIGDADYYGRVIEVEIRLSDTQ
jgi:hypothetical protein